MNGKSNEHRGKQSDYHGNRWKRGPGHPISFSTGFPTRLGRRRLRATGIPTYLPRHGGEGRDCGLDSTSFPPAMLYHFLHTPLSSSKSTGSRFVFFFVPLVRRPASSPFCRLLSSFLFTPAGGRRAGRKSKRNTGKVDGTSAGVAGVSVVVFSPFLPSRREITEDFCAART